jgi:hypothetical protein
MGLCNACGIDNNQNNIGNSQENSRDWDPTHLFT